MLRSLHARVDAEATSLAANQGSRITCHRGCQPCCQDDLSVFVIEADLIEAGAKTLLEVEKPHPPGACVFLDGDGACRIYSLRPFVCRTQGLPLRWFEEDDQGEISEQRSICHLNEPGPGLKSLPETDFWLLGPTELEIGRLQALHGAPGARRKLRNLFRNP